MTDTSSTKAGQGIYVEIALRSPLDAVWQHTQDPALHEQWDLRFSSITYLPRTGDHEAQRFRYATRIGFGLEIEGGGENVATRARDDGSSTSSLRFWSDDPKSLIRVGSGFWRYIPESGGTRFLTWYDYEPRFGRLGALVDRAVFRPLMAWATAWSFDRLRLWLDEGTHPAVALRLWLAHGMARLGVAAVFAYHGLIPKLLTHDPDELAMLRDAGFSGDTAPALLTALGIAEVLAALLLLARWRDRWPLWGVVLLMVAALIGVTLTSPRYLTAAFNPVSLNLATATLAGIALLTGAHAPSAARCRRRRPAILP